MSPPTGQSCQITLPKVSDLGRSLGDHLAAAQCLSGKGCQAETRCEDMLTYGSCTANGVLACFHVFHDPRITNRAHSRDVHRVFGHGAVPAEARPTRHGCAVSCDRTHGGVWTKGDREKVAPSESPVSRGTLRACRLGNGIRSTSRGITCFHTIGRVNACKERALGARILRRGSRSSESRATDLVFPTRVGTRRVVGVGGADRDAPPGMLIFAASPKGSGGRARER